jgi:outer membrane protein OmpA-like peptidoglycan-associated protein
MQQRLLETNTTVLDSPTTMNAAALELHQLLEEAATTAIPMPEDPEETAAPPTSFFTLHSLDLSLDLWLWLRRGLILVGVASSATIAGTMIAHFHPGSVTEPPFLEQAFRRSAQGWFILQHQPQIWYSQTLERLKAPKAQLPANFSEADRQNLETEITRLQGELAALSHQVAQLENQAGIEGQDQPLEARLARLAQAEVATSQIADSFLVLQATPFRVTLPTDLLFEDGGATLIPQADTLLKTVVADLKHYPHATVNLATYTDNVGGAKANQDLSFRRSRAIAQYLKQQLGETYQWNILGYGEGSPLVDNSTNTNRQRNRRLEITLAF